MVNPSRPVPNNCDGSPIDVNVGFPPAVGTDASWPLIGLYQGWGGAKFSLDGPEAHHLTAVRRFGPGDRVTLFNGYGREYPAEVVSVGDQGMRILAQDSFIEVS